VAVIKDKNRMNLKQNTEELLELLGGAGAFVRNNDTVLIKPNVLCGLKAETGATVCPEIVETLVRMCLDAGASKIYIAEASNWGIDSMEAFFHCGYDEVAKKTGSELIDLKKEEQTVKEINNIAHKTIKLPKLLFDVDVVINVPVLKTHNQTGVSISLKNLAVGICTDGEKQQRIHSIGLFQPLSQNSMEMGSLLDRMIVDVSRVLPPQLVVVDGFFGMHGWGSPIKGEPAGAGLLIGGTNPTAVDAVACSLIGQAVSDIPHLVIAGQKGLGEIDVEKIDTVGTPLEEAATPFKGALVTDLDSIVPENMNIYYKNACYSCISNFGYFLIQNSESLKDIGPITVILGRHDSVVQCRKGHVLYYGNCAGSNMYGGSFVPGCVPRSRRQVFEALGIGDRYESYEWADI
jgi:uncharacterized protein (DUF362 family)